MNDFNSIGKPNLEEIVALPAKDGSPTNKRFQVYVSYQ
jgi:hypothetical protein